LIKSLSINGFRGLSNQTSIDFALPNGTPGSGLTILVGANNSGKTSIIEALKVFNGQEAPSFSVGKRNIVTDGKVELCLTYNDNSTSTIRTVDEGGSSTTKTENTNLISLHKQNKNSQLNP
jgi:AAA15 family ATPase/GTPase